MKRHQITPRSDWQKKCEAAGFHYHSMGGVYWDESACYEFNANKIDELEAVTNELCEMSLAAIETVINQNRFQEFAIPEQFIPYIVESWNRREPTLYGRFDLCCDEKHPPKLLEYNADTPTALLEASVVQWQWLQEVYSNYDQFNSLHEKLIAQWRTMHAVFPIDEPLYFSCVQESMEDIGNTEYLRDTCLQADYDARQVYIEDIGWSEQEQRFVDGNNEIISVLFKLYPWEWMMGEEFGKNLLAGTMKIIEPPWKIILSNKALLVVLWEMFPEHPNLLPCYFDSDLLTTDYVKKPLLSREGANVSIHGNTDPTRHANRPTLANAGIAWDKEGNALDTHDQGYGAEGYVYQEFCPLPSFHGNYPVIGSWIVGDEAAGIGIREDNSLITKNSSRFVPHYFK